MRRLARNSAVLLVTAGALALGPTAAHAASTTWRPAGECALLTVGGCKVTTITGSDKASADDGGCAGDVGVQVRQGGTIYSAVFAHTSVTVKGSGLTGYKVWH